MPKLNDQSKCKRYEILKCFFKINHFLLLFITFYITLCIIRVSACCWSILHQWLCIPSVMFRFFITHWQLTPNNLLHCPQICSSFFKSWIFIHPIYTHNKEWVYIARHIPSSLFPFDLVHIWDRMYKCSFLGS